MGSPTGTTRRLVRGGLVGIVLAALAMVSVGPVGASAGSSVGSAAPVKGCALVTASELDRILGIGFTPEPVGRTGCFWLSEDAGIAEVVVSADRSRSAADIEVGKESLRDEPGAKVLKKVGDLAILIPAPTTSPTDVTTLTMTVFVDSDFGQVSVTLSETAPTTKQMRRLGKLLAKRL